MDHSLKGMMASLVFAGDQYQIYQVEKPNVEASELAEAARWKLKDLLDYAPEDAVVDVFEFPEGALKGRGTLLNVVACRKAMVQEGVKLIAESGLTLDSIDIAELALRNIALECAEYEDQPVALLYLRHRFGMMVLVRSGMLYVSRRFDFSLDALKDPAHQESVIQQLGLEVQRSLDYFESQMGQVPPQAIHLMGPDPDVPLANMLGGSIAAKVIEFDISPYLADSGAPGKSEINCFISMGASLRQGDK
jgi:MSHA biogenesis protein MshI